MNLSTVILQILVGGGCSTFLLILVAFVASRISNRNRVNPWERPAAPPAENAQQTEARRHREQFPSYQALNQWITSPHLLVLPPDSAPITTNLEHSALAGNSTAYAGFSPASGDGIESGGRPHPDRQNLHNRAFPAPDVTQRNRLDLRVW